MLAMDMDKCYVTKDFRRWIRRRPWHDKMPKRRDCLGVWNSKTLLGIWLMRYIVVSSASHQMSWKQNRSRNLKWMSIFFPLPILLRGFDTRTDMNDYFIKETRPKNGVQIFFFIVSFEDLKFTLEASLNHGVEIFEYTCRVAVSKFYFMWKVQAVLACSSVKDTNHLT